jgi:hypothetical protein
MKTFVKFFTFATALMGLTVTACKLDTDEPESAIAYTAAADGSAAAASTAITFTFAAALAGLEAGDIALTNGTGEVVRGALVPEEDGKVWKLGITVQKTGTVMAAIGKAGIAETETELTVYREPDSTYTATANGADNTATSTAIAFTFSKALTELRAEDITLTNDTGTVTKGDLTGGGTNWSLGIAVQTAGDVKVAISKAGIDGAEQTVTVCKAGEQAPPMDYTAAADGSITAGSTAITFSFGAAVTELGAEDITLANDTGAVTRGELSGSGQQWTLGITVQQAGDVKVSISRDGIEAGEKTIRVYAAPAPPGPALTKPIDLYLSEGLAREEWTGQDTAEEGWVLSVEEQSVVYVAAYKEAAQTITVGGTDGALVSAASAVDGISAGEEFAVFTMKTGDLVFDGGTRTFTLNVSEEGDALPRSVTVSLNVRTNQTGAAVFKLAERDGDGVEYLERVGGAFEGFVDAFKWVENNAESDAEYTLRVERDEYHVPHLSVGLNSKNGADNVSLRLRGSAEGPWILEPVDLHVTSTWAITHIDENNLGEGASFIDIGAYGENSPKMTFILGNNITLKSGQMPKSMTGTADIFISVWHNATLVLEPGSKITGHRITSVLGMIRIAAISFPYTNDNDPAKHGKLRILGGSITNCTITKNRALIFFTNSPSQVPDGAFYLAPGNVFSLSGNTDTSGMDQVNAVGFMTSEYSLYPLTEEHLANGVSMPPVPSE